MLSLMALAAPSQAAPKNNARTNDALLEQKCKEADTFAAERLRPACPIQPGGTCLTEVNPNRGDSFRRLLRCAHRRLLELCVTPPQPQPSRVGAGRGRAIPLPESRPLSNQVVGAGDERRGISKPGGSQSWSGRADNRVRGVPHTKQAPSMGVIPHSVQHGSRIRPTPQRSCRRGRCDACCRQCDPGRPCAIGCREPIGLRWTRSRQRFLRLFR